MGRRRRSRSQAATRFRKFAITIASSLQKPNKFQKILLSKEKNFSVDFEWKVSLMTRRKTYGQKEKIIRKSIYRLRLGISRVLMPGPVAIGFTLNSGVVNWRRFELPPPFRFKIGVVVAVPVALVGFFCSMFNSIKSFVLDAIADAADDVDGAGALAPEFVFIAIVYFWYEALRNFLQVVHTFIWITFLWNSLSVSFRYCRCTVLYVVFGRRHPIKLSNHLNHFFSYESPCKFSRYSFFLKKTFMHNLSTF